MRICEFYRRYPSCLSWLRHWLDAGTGPMNFVIKGWRRLAVWNRVILDQEELPISRGCDVRSCLHNSQSRPMRTSALPGSPSSGALPHFSLHSRGASSSNVNASPRLRSPRSVSSFGRVAIDSLSVFHFTHARNGAQIMFGKVFDPNPSIICTLVVKPLG